MFDEQIYKLYHQQKLNYYHGKKNVQLQVMKMDVILFILILDILNILNLKKLIVY